VWQLVGGPPHSSRQELLCSSGNIPKRIGEEKHEKTTVNLPNFDDASFCSANPPIFPLPILEYPQPAKQIGDRHYTYFSKVRVVTIADFRFWLVLGEFLGVEIFLRSILCIDHHCTPSCTSPSHLLTLSCPHVLPTSGIIVGHAVLHISTVD